MVTFTDYPCVKSYFGVPPGSSRPDRYSQGLPLVSEGPQESPELEGCKLSAGVCLPPFRTLSRATVSAEPI